MKQKNCRSFITKKREEDRVIFYYQSNYPHVKSLSNVCFRTKSASGNCEQATIARTYIILMSIIIGEVDLIQKPLPQTQTHILMKKGELQRQSALRPIKLHIKHFHCIKTLNNDIY